MKLRLFPSKDIRYYAVSEHGRIRLAEDRLVLPTDEEAVKLAQSRYGDRLKRVVKETRETVFG